MTIPGKGGSGKKGPAPLTGALLARKGQATASGFGAPQRGAAQSAPPSPPRDGRLKTTPRASKGKTVLVVERDPLNSKLLEDLLRHRGFTTVKIAGEHPALSHARIDRPDLILLQIPTGEHWAHGAIETIKNDPDLSRIPVVGVVDASRDGSWVRAGGYDAYVTKPISPADLFRAVDDVLA